MAEVIEAGEVTPVVEAATEPVAVETPEAPAEPAEQPGAVQKVEDLPPWQKALISKEKNARSAAEAERDETRRQLAALTDMVARLTTPQAQPDARPEPRPEQYSSDDDYREAVTDWRADNKANAILARHQSEASQRREQQDIADARIRYAGSVANAKVKYQDFDAVAARPDLPIPPEVAIEVLRSSQPADVQYWLGKHPDEAARIATLRPAAIAREIGRIEGRIEAAPVPRPAVSQAPKPVTPVGASNTVAKDPYQMSAKEFFEYDKQQARRR